MSQAKTAFIKIDGIPEGYHQTKPVEPEKRLPSSEIRIELCDESDADKIAEGLYTIFPPIFWVKREPPELRPSPATRISRMSQRIKPTLSLPLIKWTKAIHIPTGEIMGIACWALPGAPILLHLHRSAVPFYHLDEKMNWSKEEVEEMWSHVSYEHWDVDIAAKDEIRREVMGDERHWFLAPLMVWPEWQGRGVGKKLLDWAIEQADAKEPPEPMYLEAAITARAVYLHCGFVPVGEVNMVRRGPRKEVEGAKSGE